jgi:hypothetical protein
MYAYQNGSMFVTNHKTKGSLMARSELANRFLIVTGNIVVGEDLREMLSGLPGATIDIRRTLCEDWPGDYRLAFLGFSKDALTESPSVQRLRDEGTKVVVLDGLLSEHADERDDFAFLPQPFRTADVSELLQSLGIAT